LPRAGASRAAGQSRLAPSGSATEPESLDDIASFGAKTSRTSPFACLVAIAIAALS
jgi:hypothetical protein